MNDSWEPKRLIEERYKNALERLFAYFSKTLKQLIIFDVADVLTAFRKYCESDGFIEYTQAAASKMITALYYENAKTWREAAQKSMRGKLIYQALQKEMNGSVGWKVKSLIDENAKLISTFPDLISKQVNTFIYQETLKGRRAEFIAQDLMRQFPKVSESRIKLIARTEAAKASSAITRSRAENLNLDWYVWRTSGDERVRDSHRLMRGVIVGWIEPPSPEALINVKSSLGYYHAGNCPNCRCYSQPLISYADVQWPCKVYHAGQIKVLTLADFEYMAKIHLQKAA